MINIKGFRVLELPLDNQKFAHHYLYIKEHNDRENPGKTLFVGNIDYLPFMTHEDIDKYLRVIFDRFGEIMTISVSEFANQSNDKDDTRFAHVIFTKKSSLKVILNANESDYELACQEAAEALHLLQDRPVMSRDTLQNMFGLFDADEDELEEEVNNYMKDFDEKELFEIEQRKQIQNQPDADGFVTVTNRNKRKRTEDVGEEINQRNHRRLANRQRNKKKKHYDLKHFYRFQIREEKLQQLELLRKKFDEDKAKIQRMKDSRKFVPF